jgi:hypothetical protein
MRTGKGSGGRAHAKCLKIGAQDKTFDFDFPIQLTVRTSCNPKTFILQRPPVVTERPQSIGDIGMTGMDLSDTPENYRVEAR